MAKKEKKFSGRFLIIALTLLFFTATFLRTYLLNHNLFFGPEQGIDFMVVKDLVVNHKITLIGAKTDINGIFHGPIYYYVSAIPFFLSHGNPLFISYFLITLNCLTVFFIFLLGRALFTPRVGLIASVIFTVSFTPIVYSRWLSTHPLAIPLVCLYFLFLINFLKGSKRSLWGAAVALGLLMQSEFLNILFFSVITLSVVIIFFKEFKKQHILSLLSAALLAGIIAVGSFVFFDLRHQFLITNNILALSKSNIGYHISYLQAFISSLQTLFNLVSSVIVPFSFILALLIFSAAIFLLIREKTNRYRLILFVWLFIPPGLLILLRHEILDQFFVALIPAIIISVAFLIDKMWKKISPAGVGLLLLVLAFNLFAYGNNIPKNNKIFFQAPQLGLRYSDQLQVIDAIYQKAHGKPFSFQSYTIPYWEQQGWQYLFENYGRTKYGYLPIEQKADTLFVIVQRDSGNSSYQQNWLKNEVSKWGAETEQVTFGDLTVKELHVVSK